MHMKKYELAIMTSCKKDNHKFIIYLNRQRLRITKELRVKLKLQTGKERSPYGLLLTGKLGKTTL